MAATTQHHRVRQGNSFHSAMRYSQRWTLVPLLLWIGMWANLDTGFWNIYDGGVGFKTIFDDSRSLNDWALFIRAAIPYFALPMSLVFLGLQRHKLPVMKGSPTVFLAIYGCIAAIATAFSPSPLMSQYWSVTFVAAVLCTWLMVKQPRPVLSGRVMLEATWVICFIALLILAYMGRGSIFENQSGDMGYGVINDLHGASRASGVGRWAAVPGLVFLMRVFLSPSMKLRMFYLASSLFCLYVVYRVQSRGAFFGVLGALLFAVLYGRQFQRKFIVVFFWIAIALIGYVSVGTTQNFGGYRTKFSNYIHRGQSEEEFESMTGRTRAYRHGIEVFCESPLLGTGQWTDRLNSHIGEHIHNTFLQALLNAGIIGFIPFAASWILGWLLFFRLWRKELPPIEQQRLLEAGVVMAFFTLRAIPETTTASFSVDLMVMLAVYCYMDALGVQVLEPVVGKARRVFARGIVTGTR